MKKGIFLALLTAAAWLPDACGQPAAVTPLRRALMTDTNNVLQGASTNLFAANLERLGDAAGVVRPEVYGATGVGDDYLALQAAIDVTPTGGLLVLREGRTYTTSRGLTVDRPMRIQGGGTIKEASILTNLLYITSDDVTIDGITIEGIETSGDFDSGLATNRIGILATQVKGLTVRNAAISSKSYGISIRDCTNSVLSGLTLTGFLSEYVSGANWHAGINVDSGLNARVEGARIEKYGNAILFSGSPEHGIVSECIVTNCFDNGIYVSSGRDITVSDNQVTAVLADGIKVRSARHVVQGNHIRNALRGIVVQPTSTLLEGDIDDAYTTEIGAAVSYSGFGATVQANVIRHTTSHGIDVDDNSSGATNTYSMGVKILDNTLQDVATGASTYPLRVFGAQRVRIQGNMLAQTVTNSTVILAAQDTVTSTYVSRMELIDNTIWAPHYDSVIYLAGVRDSKIANNDVTGGGTVLHIDSASSDIEIEDNRFNGQLVIDGADKISSARNKIVADVGPLFQVDIHGDVDWLRSEGDMLITTGSAEAFNVEFFSTNATVTSILIENPYIVGEANGIRVILDNSTKSGNTIENLSIVGGYIRSTGDDRALIMTGAGATDLAVRHMRITGATLISDDQDVIYMDLAPSGALTVSGSTFYSRDTGSSRTPFETVNGSFAGATFNGNLFGSSYTPNARIPIDVTGEVSWTGNQFVNMPGDSVTEGGNITGSYFRNNVPLADNRLTGSGSPSGSVTPRGWYDLYWDSAGSDWWMSHGTTNTSWTQLSN